MKTTGKVVGFILIIVLGILLVDTYTNQSKHSSEQFYSVTTDVCSNNIYNPAFTSGDCARQYEAEQHVSFNRTMYYPGSYVTTQYYSPSPAHATLYFYGPQWLVVQ